MSSDISIIGCGWVTPLGRSITRVCEDLDAGESAPIAERAFAGAQWHYHPVDGSSLDDVTRLRRLRRSGLISLMAVAAAKDAVTDSKHEIPASTPLFFATSNGGVRHTSKFFGDVVEEGPGAGSPLLFPETVYNAPPSHIAAELGIHGEATTLVGDSTTGLQALVAAADLLASEQCDYALVVAADEFDGVALSGLSGWGVVAPPSRKKTACEGAAAVLLTKGRQGELLVTGHREFQPDIAQINQPTMQLMPQQAHNPVRAPLLADDCWNEKNGGANWVLPPDEESLSEQLGEGLSFTTLAQVIRIREQLRHEGLPQHRILCAVGFSGGCLLLRLTWDSRSG